MTGPGNIPAPSPGSLSPSPIFSPLNERAELVSFIATFTEKIQYLGGVESGEVESGLVVQE